VTVQRHRILATVIVCTHNRGRLLSEGLPELLAQQLPAGRYEVLVVDNACSDDTPERVGDLLERYPGRIRYVREDRLGLSSARNAGIRHANGPIIAFIDDDAVPDQGWLASLVSAFDSPMVACAGGPVIPVVEGNLPPWFSPKLQTYISVFDKGSEPVPLTYNEYPRGVNIAFRKTVFHGVGLFSVSFGRKGRSLMSYEEIELCYRIERAGWTILYVPGASVHHTVHAERLSRDWFLRRFYWQGKSEAYFDLIHRGTRFIAEKLLEHARFSNIRKLMTSHASNSEDFYFLCRRQTRLGYLMGLVQGLLTAQPLRAHGQARPSFRIALRGGLS
jgi:GT2 family glycosyltransferase